MIAVIFNPTARGDKARQLRKRLADLGGDVRCLPTRSPGDAIQLAAEAVDLGAETVVAAGGDGTVNEVLNGLALTPEGLTRCRLGVLPLGTINVFAKELGLPTNLATAWQTIRNGRERRVDLPLVEFVSEGMPARRHFAQLAGAGLDSRAIQKVRWELKKRLGPLAYLLAGVQALQAPTHAVELSGHGAPLSGGLVLIGNGRYYGGRFPFFPAARLDDGLLHATLVPRLNWLVFTRIFFRLLANRLATSPDVVLRQGLSFQLTCPQPMPLQVEGDAVGSLPARFSVQPGVLRVLCP
jgi:diacylglycerol kinase (ATP)